MNSKPTELEERIDALAEAYRDYQINPGEEIAFKVGYRAALQDPLVIALRDALEACGEEAERPGHSWKICKHEVCVNSHESLTNFDQALASLKGER